MAQRRQSAKLAGRPPPSLLDCAEQVCSQAAAAEVLEQGEGQQQRQRAAGGRQAAQLACQLNADDLRELHRLVQLLKRMQASVGLEPLPQAVQRVLHESGLVAWLQQQQREEQQQGEQEQQQGAAAPSSEAVAEDLPLPLRCVLLKAQQLAADWERQQQQVVHTQQPLDGQQVQTQQQLDSGQGVALVQELLSRLAAETAADSLAEQHQAAQAAQRQQQQQRDPGVLTISTIHAAKGLEWRRVLLPTVSEGFLPVQFRPAPALMADWQAAAAGQEEAQYWSCKRAHEEEERRLFHVAATRARDGLLVSYVQPPAPGGRGSGGAAAVATLELLGGTDCLCLLAWQLNVEPHDLRPACLPMHLQGLPPPAAPPLTSPTAPASWPAPCAACSSSPRWCSSRGGCLRRIFLGCGPRRSRRSQLRPAAPPAAAVCWLLAAMATARAGTGASRRS